LQALAGYAKDYFTAETLTLAKGKPAHTQAHLQIKMRSTLAAPSRNSVLVQ